MTTNRVAILRESVKRVVQILAEREIQVRQAGSKAFVEYDPVTHVPRLVCIPFIPDNAPDELIAAVQGFIDHEVGHLLHSDFSCLAQHAGTAIGDLHNMIEDTYVERKMRERFAGSAANFRVIYETYVTRVMDRELKKAETPEQKIGVLLSTAIRAWSGQDFFEDYMKDKWDVMKPLTDKLSPDLIKRLSKVNSTQDALEIAKAIDKASRKPQEGQPKKGESKSESQPEDGDKSEGGAESSQESPEESDGEQQEKDDLKPEKQESRSDGKSEKGESEGEEGEPESEEGEPESEEGEPESEEGESESEEGESESEEGEGEGGESEEGESEEGEGEGGESKEGESEEGESEEEDEPEIEELPESEGEIETKGVDLGGAMSHAKDFSSSLTNWISETTIDLQKDADYLVYTTDFDKIEPLKVPKNMDMKLVENLEDTVNHMVGPIQKDLERAIVAHSRSFWQPGRRNGRLHGANLSRLMFNDDRVFRQREVHTCKDTAIELVIDCSGSMRSKNKIDVATQAAYALSMTLDRMQIAHEVIGFTTYWNDTKEYQDARNRMYDEMYKLRRTSFSRQDCIVMPIVKDFDERITTEHKRRFAAMPHLRNSQMFGNNIDGECIEIAARRLARRKEARKVMIVLSDGAPAGDGDGYEIQRHTKRVIESIEKSSGMEIVGIGIASNAVKQFYARHVVLNDIDSLPAVVMGELKHALLHA